MVSMPDTAGTFSKLKGFFTALLPVIAAVVGFFVGPFLLNGLRDQIRSIMAEKLGYNPGADKPGIGIRDIQAYAWWIPVGIIVAIGVGLASWAVAKFGGDMGKLASRVILGFGAGLLLYCIYNPWSDDIGWSWW